MHLKWKNVSYRVESIVRKGEIACYKQFLLSHNVFHSYISLVRQNAVLGGNGLNIQTNAKAVDGVQWTTHAVKPCWRRNIFRWHQVESPPVSYQSTAV